MATKKAKYAGFMAKADELLAKRAQGPEQAPPEDPYAKLSDDEKFALEAAVVNGYPDVSPYAQDAYNRYQGLLDSAKKSAEAYHYTPKTEQYDDFINRYIASQWGDDQILGIDQVRNMYDLYGANVEAQQKKDRIGSAGRGRGEGMGTAGYGYEDAGAWQNEMQRYSLTPSAPSPAPDPMQGQPGVQLSPNRMR